MSKSHYQAMALLGASVGIIGQLIDHPQFAQFQATILWTDEQLREVIAKWPVAKDGAPLIEWLHPRLKNWEDTLSDVPLTVATQMAEQMLSDLAGRLRDGRKLALLSGAHDGVLGLSRLIDPDGDYEDCERASQLLESFYKEIEFIP